MSCFDLLSSLTPGKFGNMTSYTIHTRKLLSYKVLNRIDGFQTMAVMHRLCVFITLMHCASFLEVDEIYHCLFYIMK